MNTGRKYVKKNGYYNSITVKSIKTTSFTELFPKRENACFSW